MCHNLFAVMYFSQIYFTTNKKPRRPFWPVSTSYFFGLFCYSPFRYYTDEMMLYAPTAASTAKPAMATRVETDSAEET